MIFLNSFFGDFRSVGHFICIDVSKLVTKGVLAEGKRKSKGKKGWVKILSHPIEKRGKKRESNDIKHLRKKSGKQGRRLGVFSEQKR